MKSITLEMRELRSLRDYLRWVELDSETLRNHILNLLHIRGLNGVSEKIENYCSSFLDRLEFTTLKDVSEFIESIDLDEITI